MNRNAGFTLLELMLSLGLTGIAVVGAYKVVTRSVKFSQTGISRIETSMSTKLLMTTIEGTLNRRYGGGFPASVSAGPRSLSIYVRENEDSSVLRRVRFVQQCAPKPSWLEKAIGATQPIVCSDCICETECTNNEYPYVRMLEQNQAGTVTYRDAEFPSISALGAIKTTHIGSGLCGIWNAAAAELILYYWTARETPDVPTPYVVEKTERVFTLKMISNDLEFAR